MRYLKIKFSEFKYLKKILGLILAKKIAKSKISSSKILGHNTLFVKNVQRVKFLRLIKKILDE